jgi:hypothetical protein
MVTLHFKGPVGIWLQAVHKRLQGLDWIPFTSLLCTRFGRDRHQLLIRQFYVIKQITTVADYIERFDILMNHLMSYHEDTHPYYFLTRFIEGLRQDIRAVVMIQRPADLDSACSLALLQEEVCEGEHLSPLRPPDQRYVRFPMKTVTAQSIGTSDHHLVLMISMASSQQELLLMIASTLYELTVEQKGCVTSVVKN